MRQKLTKKVVETVTPGTRDQLLWDSEVPGFGLKVTPSGKRTYFAYYRTPSGQQRKPKIGEHGVLTVDDARQIARQWLAMANAGHDVSQERKANRSAFTVGDLAERYLNEYAVPNKRASSVASDRANLQNHVVPTLGAMRVAASTEALSASRFVWKAMSSMRPMMLEIFPEESRPAATATRYRSSSPQSRASHAANKASTLAGRR